MEKIATLAQTLVAQVCLYGARHCGFAYYAVIPSRELKTRFVGEGGWNADHGVSGSLQSLTECVYLACDDLRRAGVTDGLVRIFEPSGERYCDVPVSRPPAVGAMTWTPC